MSGSIISTGILTNDGANLLDIERIMDERIKDIESAIGTESTEGTILYRIKALETANQGNG